MTLIWVVLMCIGGAFYAAKLYWVASAFFIGAALETIASIYRRRW